MFFVKCFVAICIQLWKHLAAHFQIVPVDDRISVWKWRCIPVIHENRTQFIIRRRKCLRQIEIIIHPFYNRIADHCRFVKSDPGDCIGIFFLQRLKIHLKFFFALRGFLCRDHQLFHFIVLLSAEIIRDEKHSELIEWKHKYTDRHDQYGDRDHIRFLLISALSFSLHSIFLLRSISSFLFIFHIKILNSRLREWSLSVSALLKISWSKSDSRNTVVIYN